MIVSSSSALRSAQARKLSSIAEPPSSRFRREMARNPTKPASSLQQSGAEERVPTIFGTGVVNHVLDERLDFFGASVTPLSLRVTRNYP